MIKFLFKGLIRDRSRSLFPTIIVIIGVMLTVTMYCWMNGALSEIVRSNANFDTGHVKIMSRAYAKESDQIPNDLAFIGVANLMNDLKQQHSDMIWTPRIRFGGLLDIPDEKGETKSQGPVVGLAIDLLSDSSSEIEILNLNKAIVRGRMPQRQNEILVSDEFAKQLNIKPGKTATLITSTMYGSFTMENFTVVGTIRFGITAMDRGAMLADVSDIQMVMDMHDAAGEILGFFKDDRYHRERAKLITATFNENHTNESDEFSPIMMTLREQNGLAQMLDMYSSISMLGVVIFIIVMSIVLWNAGLMGSLRRYGEIGVRLAIGEYKGHIYRSMIAESMMIGLIGSILGTIVGLIISYYLQIHGFDISAMTKNSSMLMSNVMRAQVTPASYFIGFIPGFLATLLGTSISGIGIYKRQTSQLTKELEA